MGYFDTLSSSAFKTNDDGQKLFFPWGTLGHGYIIPSDAEFERLQYRYKNVTVFSILVGIAAIIFLKSLLSIVAFLFIFIAAYMVWVRYQCRNLRPTQEKLTFSENATNQSRAYNPFILWLLEIISLIFIGIGVLMFLVDPANWLIAVLSLVLFGFSAVVLGRMIIIQRRDSGRRL